MTNTYYCPRGCNVCDERAVEALGLECGNCGSIMTTNRTAYDDVHERRELELIEASEPRVLHDERGYFIGMDYRGVNRLSVEYWTTKEAADYALKYHRWTARNLKSDEWEWGD
jgi:hypothetical protein